MRFSRARAEPRTKTKTMGEGARGEGSENNPHCSSPIVFCFDLGSAFARLKLLLCELQKKHRKDHGKLQMIVEFLSLVQTETTLLGVVAFF